MKRQFCDVHARDTEFCDEELEYECPDHPHGCESVGASHHQHPSSGSSKAAAAASAASLNSLFINSCCKKCKNCYRHLNSLNPRPNEVALRLKEKSKKKKETAAEISRKAELQQEEMNSDESDEEGGAPCIHHHMHTGSASRRSKSRTSSNDSKECTLQVDCKCKTCLQRQKLMDELIAEEESSKKKKAKKKKKKNSKKTDTVEEESEDEDSKPDTKDEDSHGHSSSGGAGGHKSAHAAGVVDPTSVDINQWIKVKNKYSGKLDTTGKASGTKISSSNTSSANSSSSGPPAHHDDEMESNGFKLIGGSASADKRRNSNLDSFSKDFDQMSLSDLKNGSATSNIVKAKLLAIDANMAYIRGEVFDAIHLITECIENDPNSPVYFINRSYYHERNKDFEKALKDAEKAIKLEESGAEEYLEYSLYRKAMALSGLERFEQVEHVLNAVLKMLAAKCKSSAAVFASLAVRIEKDLLINRLKKLVSADYTLPLARLYAVKYDSIPKAIKAIDQNNRLLEGAGESCLNLQMHLQLINDHLDKVGSKNKSSSLKNILKSPTSISLKHSPNAKPKQLPLHKLTTPRDKDLWNFQGDFDETDQMTAQALGVLMGEQSAEEEALNEEAFLSDFDDDGDDSEVYFSDEDEYEMLYSHPDRWNSPKDILQLNSGKDHIFTDDLKDPINSKGQKALWIGNVSPNCSINLVSHVFMKFGSVTFCKIFPNERANEVAYLLLHYDNDISPRLVMAYFKDKVIPGISQGDLPLIIRFRNKNDKAEGDMDASFGSATGSSIVSSPQVPQPQPTTHAVLSSTGDRLTVVNHSGSNSVLGGSSVLGPNKQQTSECYYWRTTGCDRERCNFKHIPAHKGIDKQSWMRRKN